MTSQENLQIRQYYLFWQIFKIRCEKMLNSAKNILPTIADPDSTFSVSLEVVLLKKDENRVGQLFLRSLNHTI